jgi:hypothetical protein
MNAEARHNMLRRGTYLLKTLPVLSVSGLGGQLASFGLGPWMSLSESVVHR